MRPSDRISCQLFLPALDEPTMRAMLAAIESTLPTAPLVYRIAPTGSVHAVEDPGAWGAAHLLGEVPEVLCNGKEHELVSLMASYKSPHSVSGGVPLVQASLAFPSTPAFLEAVPDFVGAVGPAANAYWGHATRVREDSAMAKGAGRRSPDPGFPRLRSPSVAIPGRLAWVSYWSEEACRWLDFSPADPRAALFARVSPIPGHGVVVQLTEDLLDLDRPEHLAALTAAYEAFPAIDAKWGL